jgi:AcrR family transcriptional regulator
MYHVRMPKRWAETVDEHRGSIRDAVLDATAELVTQRGLTGVTMAGIAEATGIGRATLYRYFPDVDAVLTAWHERQLATHLAHLTGIRARSSDPAAQLREVLTGYAHMSRRRGGAVDSIAASLHSGPHAAQAVDQVSTLVTDVLKACVGSGAVRTDVPPGELAAYCLHALSAVGPATSGAALRRLVAVTLDGLRPVR